MKEADVLSAFLTGVRKALPTAVVVKHRDASMIGLPDASVTHNGRVFWLEAKLYLWEPWMAWSEYDDTAARLAKKAKAGGPAQYDTLCRLNGLYVFWVKKSFVLVFDPVSSESVVRRGTAELVEWFAFYALKHEPSLRLPIGLVG